VDVSKPETGLLKKSSSSSFSPDRESVDGLSCLKKKIAGGGEKAPKGENALFEVSLQFFPSTIFFQEIKKKEN
jgi:hypothetical protein